LKVEKTYDIRINVIDDEVIAVAIYASKQDKLQTIDIRKNNMQNVRYELITLPSILRNKILELCRSYELRFAAIDMAFTKDYQWVFFEVNPNGQWAWLDLEGVTDIASLLLNSMQLNFA
jgi:glutathione synthase/RimK-type ligase-like ATP-grasp enzyme